jgi:hypothetical protein
MSPSGYGKSESPEHPKTNGAFTGLRRFQFIEPIASPKTLVVMLTGSVGCYLCLCSQNDPIRSASRRTRTLSGLI